MRANKREYARRRYAADPVGRAAYAREWRRSDPTGRNHSWYVPIGPERKFWAKVDKGDGAGCWLWTGKTNRDGYGVLTRQRKGWFAHRYSWTLANGDIPDGMMACHTCDNPPCIRPDHLFLGTRADNLRDMRAKGRGRGPGHATASAAA